MEMNHNFNLQLLVLKPCKQPQLLIDTILFLKFMKLIDVHKVGETNTFKNYEFCKHQLKLRKVK